MDTRIPLPGIHKEPSFIPSNIRKDAVSGSYVDLEEFLPSEFFRPRDNAISIRHNPGTDKLTFHRSLPGRPIEDFSDWLAAWNNYERVLLNSDCALYHSLVSYRELILGCTRKFNWPSVYTYDRCFRAKLGATSSLHFDIMDHDLYVSILDSSAVRRDVPRCYRCKSFNHKVSHCPFPRSSRRQRRATRNGRRASTPSLQSPAHVDKSHLQQAMEGPAQTLSLPWTHPVPPSQLCQPLPTTLKVLNTLSSQQTLPSASDCTSTPHTLKDPASSHASARSIQPSLSHAIPACRKHTPDSASMHLIATSAGQLLPSAPHVMGNPAQSHALAGSIQSSTSHATSAPHTQSSLDSAAAVQPANIAIPAHHQVPLTHMPPPAQVINTPVQILNAEAFRHGLQTHEDRDFAEYIVTACKEGVDIGYKGPRFYREFKNWPSADTFSTDIQAAIDKDLASGIKVGPFPHPPYPNFVGSPMGAFQRKHSNKVRTIHDLSWKPGVGINDFINKDDFHLKYLTLDEVISGIIQRGRHTLLAKLDLEAAFHHIPVRPQDFELLGSTFSRFNPVTNAYCKEYYYDRVLQFGARSSPKLFNDFATAAEFIMHTNGATYAEHYLDDYITMGTANSSECADNLQIMIDTCGDLGFSLNPNKLCHPSTVMEYLGIVLDTDLFQARISSERLTEVLTELYEWRHRQSATKRQILSLVGKLTFVSRVVRPGRTFIRRMISLASKLPHLHYRVQLTHDFQMDVDWWLHYLPQWNGVSLFPQNHWESNIDLHLYTDSSDIAAAGFFSGAWFVVPFLYEFQELKETSINWRELFAVVVAAATFGSLWKGKQIMFHCDNMCVVEVVTSGSCRSDTIMNLIRKLFYICARYEFEISMRYVNTKVNDIADALSRLQLDRFRKLAPHADRYMTMPVVM